MNNLLCSMCHSEDATCFCYCNGQDTILCELDYQRHTQKTKIVHLKCPLAALPDHKIPGYFERLSARTSRIELGKTDLVKNLEVVDTCIAELSIKETQILTTLTDFFEDRIVHLHEVKSGLEREIYEAIEEVDSTMYEDTPVLHNKLSQFLRQGRTSLNFFKYVIDSSPYPSDLNNVLQFTQGIDADTTEFPSVPSSSQELKDTVSRLSVANEKIKVLEARLQYWGIVFDPPIEYQGTVSDYTTPKSRAAIKKFGSYPSQDEEIVLVKRGPVVLEEGVYTGHWNNRNERHGYGKFSYKSGELYEGHWQNGNKTGKGRSISPDGTVYIGEFFLGVFSGLGTKYCTNGDEFSGTWVNGKLQGFAIVKYGDSGDFCIGECIDDKLNGRGAYFWHDGKMYVGAWKSGNKHGTGALVSPDGQMYAGEYEDNMRSGKGCFVYSNGDVYRGGWSQGKPSGEGRLTNPGIVKEGIWAEGALLRSGGDSGLRKH